MEENQALIRPALRPLFYALGWLAFLLGAIGAFLPVLPTTPFLILSAYLFGKSSPRLHRWLLSLPTFGPMIKDWEDNKVIRPKTKVWAISLLTALIWLSILFAEIHFLLKAMLALIWAMVGLFIYTRKSR